MAGKGMYRMSRKIWIFPCSESGAERRDLTRRLIVGAILTAPVVFAMMAHEFFDPKNAVATEEYQGKTYDFCSAPLGLDPPPMNRCR